MTRSSQPRRHVDPLALFEGHDRALGCRLQTETALERLPLAAPAQRVDALDLDVEELLHGFLDLRLGRGERDLEDHLGMLGRVGRFLGDDRRQYYIVMAQIGRAHLNRASNASTAARVSTS